MRTSSKHHNKTLKIQDEIYTSIFNAKISKNKLI